MSDTEKPFIAFLRDFLRRRKLLPSQLAAGMGISQATVSRWLSGKDIPSITSCKKLADYSGTSVGKILWLAGYLSDTVGDETCLCPEFRRYARPQHPGVLDEDLVIMIEDLIKRKRSLRHVNGKDSKLER